MKTFKLAIIFFFIIILFFFLLNKETTRKIGINYDIIEYKIPYYLKINDFFNRHFNYKYLVKTINENQINKKNIIINTTKWVNHNIRKIPEGVEIVDHHPLTIVQRRLGVHDQFNDILSVFLIYLSIDSFFIKNFEDIYHPLTFFKINNYWSVIDPYYGVYFIDNNRKFSSLENLRTSNWDIVNLDSKKINSLNISDIYFDKFQSYDEVKNHYIKIFTRIKSSDQIDDINIYDRGGRSYIQKPLNRLIFEVYKFLN